MRLRLFFSVIVLLAPPPIKPWLLRWLCGAQTGRHVHIGWLAAPMGRNVILGDYSEIGALTLIRVDGDVHLGSYSKIASFTLVYGSASLIVGSHSYIGPQSLINADEDVRIGNYSAVGPRAMIYTHGSYLPYTEGYWVKFGGVTLGDYVWCAAGVFIHPGVTIGDAVFVNSRSVIRSDIAEGEVIEGFPAVPLGKTASLRRTMAPRRVDAAIVQMLRHFAEVILRRSLAIVARDELPERLSFTCRGIPYVILCVLSTGSVPPVADSHRVIWVVNRPEWAPPDKALVLDFTRMRTHRGRDRVLDALWLHAKRYYGVQFEFEER